MNIVVTDHYDCEVLAALTTKIKADWLQTDSCIPQANQLHSCDILLIRSRTPITASLLADAPNLKLIVSATAGFDHIDLKACREREVVVSYTPEAHSQNVVELTLMLMLMLAQNWRGIEASDWRPQQRSRLLNDKHLGLVGLGRIGSGVAQIATALGMKILAYDPYVEESVFVNLHCERVGFTELLKMSHFVSLHVPLTAKTRFLINAATIAEMNSDAFLINTSRGSVVNEDDLMKALDRQQIAGAALDVFHHEPVERSKPVRQHPQIISTPHIGGYAEESLKSASRAACQRVVEFISGGAVQHRLPPSAQWYEV